MQIIFAVVIIYYNALFPHKININVCLCVFPPCFGDANSAYVRREPHLSSMSGQTEAGSSSTTWFGGPRVTPERAVLKARDGRQAGRQLCPAPGRADPSGRLPLMNMEEPSLSRGLWALFLFTTPLLSDRVSLLLLLFPLC